MIKNNLLVRINDLNEIEEYKKVGITNFLFALKDYSIGYNEFKVEELNKLDINVYLLMNRVFDNDTCDKLRNIKDSLSFVKGILFTDIAVYMILKDTNINLIWNDTHATISTYSVNTWLKNVYSSTISNELEHTELNEVLNNVSKKVILPILGLNMAMYSRRYLLSYYNDFYGIEGTKIGYLRTNNNIEFLAKENEYGTVLFYNKYYNLINEIDNLNKDNILFYYVDPNGLTPKETLEILDGKEIEYDNRFYQNKTVYKIGDLND